MIDGSVVLAGYKKIRIAIDDGGDGIGGVGIGFFFASCDDQQAVVRLGPLEIAIQIIFEPGIGVLRRKL